MFTRPRDPNNKHKPAYKNYCSKCHRTNYSISTCLKKHRDNEDKREAHARSNPTQKSFVQYFRSSSRENNSYRTKNKLTDSFDRYRVEVHPVQVIQIETFHHKILVLI